MNPAFASDPTLPPILVESILSRLGLQQPPEPTLGGLRTLYSAWCQNVPFDNTRKLIHVRSGNGAPLPGTTPEDYFNAWLKHGTGGTCWSGAGALHALLVSLGFDAVRGIATMLAAPNLPPNHGTVQVTFDSEKYLVDSSMLHGEPLRLSETEKTAVNHPAWGLRCIPNEGHWQINWRPLHKVDGLQCRLERFGATADEYRISYDGTRGWSPFNYEVTARKNCDGQVSGLAFGKAITLRNDGSVESIPVSQQDRQRILIEQIGLSEEIVSRLPPDSPTPPPPGSRTAQTS